MKLQESLAVLRKGRESAVNSCEITMSLIWYTCTRDTLLFLADGLCWLIKELPGQT